MHLISRRTLVAGSLAARAVTRAFAQSQLENLKSKLRIVVTGGHPGDPEYGCGGTIARYTDLGYEVVLLYLNRGDKQETPTRPARPLRRAEGKNASPTLAPPPPLPRQLNHHPAVHQ